MSQHARLNTAKTDISILTIAYNHQKLIAWNTSWKIDTGVVGKIARYYVKVTLKCSASIKKLTSTIIMIKTPKDINPRGFFLFIWH